MINKAAILIIAVIAGYFIYAELLSAGDHIEKDKSRWEIYFKDVHPAEKVSKWLLPFKVNDRGDSRNFSVISTFGAHRNSYVPGHKHTGLDCVPKPKPDGASVFAMAEGVVCSIHLGDPHRTVVVRHRTAGGDEIFSSYKHLGDIFVENGQQVDHNTKLARLYTGAEARELGGNYDHLHLEIRKKFDDFGCASWATMNKEELQERFYDPLKFIKENVRK